MKASLTYVKDPRVKKIIELSMNLRELLRYPNSENSRDERHYTEWFEKEVLTTLDRTRRRVKTLGEMEVEKAGGDAEFVDVTTPEPTHGAPR